MEQYIFTPSSVLDLLTQITELSEYEIGFTETFDNKFRLTVGDSVYDIEPESVQTLKVDDSTISDIQDTNMEAYESLESEGVIGIANEDISNKDDVEIESGIIKEALKTLLVGGMVRLTGKMLSNKQ